MHSLWTPLRLSLHLSCSPPLLIKYDFRPSSYTIHVTDLTYIWTEHLDRKQILRRALSLDTSIDPSEDAGQMEQFLRHVQDSLRGTRSTKLSLIQGDAPKHLVLNTFTSLPAPLEPLQWPIYLAPAGQNVFTGEFVLPYLSQQLNAKAQIESLLQQLKDKDHVISRMTDKMQSDGLDFSKVFPSAAVSKARNRLDSRESVARLVKGLGEFDEEQWRSGFASQNRSLEDVVSGIFTPGAFEFANVTFKSSDFDQWWDHVEDDRNSEDREGREDLIARRGAEHNVETAKDKSDPNPEFQRQSTPPQLKTSPEACQETFMANEGEERRAILPSPKAVDGDSTTDDSDEDLQPSETKAKSQRRDSPVIIEAKTVPQHDRLGSQTEGQPSPNLNNKLKNIKDEMIMSSNSHEESASVSADDMNEGRYKTHSGSEPRAKLGKIGGKGKVLDKPTRKLHKPVGDHGIPHHNRPTNPGTNVESSISGFPTATGNERTGRTVTKAKSPLPRESSQERADRKRAELKRELEEKSRGTAKKKRKF